MIPTLFELILLVALALIFARLFGYIFDRLKQPAVIGEILAGILLGGIGVLVFTGQQLTLLNYQLFLPNLDYLSDEFHLLAEIGILFLLFISGLETSLAKLRKMEKASSFVAAGGIILPFLLGYTTGMYIGFSTEVNIVLGLILIATSVGVTVRSLLDLHELDTDVGTTILGGAVIDDILGIILLAFILGYSTLIDLAFIALKISLFFLIFLYLGLRIMEKILDLGEKIHLPKSFLSIALAVFLIYAYFADAFGIAGIIGAFVAGLLIGQSVKSRKIIDDVHALGYGFFIPLFFVWVGATLWEEARLDLAMYTTTVLLAVLLIFVAIIGKIAGCGIGAWLAGMTRRASLQIGIGMIPRMELALIIASAAVSQGILIGQIAHHILATTILLTIVTTFITPFLLKAVFNNHA